MAERFEIRIAGEGGQGVVLAGLVLAEAITGAGSLNVMMTQTYGSQQRGGASRVDIVVSDSRIDYPKVLRADILVALNEDACEKYFSQMRSGGTIIAESSRVAAKTLEHGVTVEYLPMEETATRVAGTKVSINMVALGAVAGLTEIVAVERLEEAILKLVSSASQSSNIKALQAGYKLGFDVKAGKLPSTNQ